MLCVCALSSANIYLFNLPKNQLASKNCISSIHVWQVGYGKTIMSNKFKLILFQEEIHHHERKLCMSKHLIGCLS